MGLFSRLERFDQKLTRGYARWGRWMWRTLIAVPVLIVLWNIGLAVWGGPGGGAILEIHSEIDRPIRGFSVNGVAGANAFANGGGKTTCCGDIRGKTAEVIWTLDMTHEQYLKGMRLEQRQKNLPLPRREWGDAYLHVHFLPGDNVLLGWSKDSISPYEDRHSGGYKTRVRQDVKDKLYHEGNQH